MGRRFEGADWAAGPVFARVIYFMYFHYEPLIQIKIQQCCILTSTINTVPLNAAAVLYLDMQQFHVAAV